MAASAVWFKSVFAPEVLTLPVSLHPGKLHEAIALTLQNICCMADDQAAGTLSLKLSVYHKKTDVNSFFIWIAEDQIHDSG